MKKLANFNIKNIDIPFLGVMVVAFILRFVNLGYSDFQGDEIKALFLPDSNETFLSFLFNQRKGPLQFVFTLFIKLFDPLYVNQFLVRLPFTIAGFLAVYFFYKLVKLHFGNKVALYASFLMATNGFLVAFARIAQYQSQVILFCVLALYCLSLAIYANQKQYTKIMMSFVFWALALLSHYDAVFIAFPMLFLLITWFKKSQYPLKSKLVVVGGAILLFLVLTLSFYLPFAMYLTQSTKDYWNGRLTGDVSGKVSSSYYLFTVYQPIYVIHFYLGFAAIFVLAFLISILPTKIKNFLVKLPFIKYLVDQANIIFMNQSTRLRYIGLLVTFVFPFVFWEKIVYIPGTHIYTYLIPAFVGIGAGIVWAENTWEKLTTKNKLINGVLIKNILLVVFLVFVSLQSFAIFVENGSEYPWESEKFFFWTLNQPTPIYHLSLFGFPYFRDWESIGHFISEHADVPYYSTNERESISRHYISLNKDTDKAGFYVYIKNPQSFTNDIGNQKALYWASKYPPVYTMSKNGVDLVNIYLMQPGTVQEIEQKGY